MTAPTLIHLAALAALAGITTPSHAETRPTSSIGAHMTRAKHTTGAEFVHALGLRLPRTQVAKVDCRRIPGICEVQAGTNLFYVDTSARYLIVGRVYDMETRQDLTAARLLEINPDLLLGSAPSARGSSDDTALAAHPHGAPMPTVASAPPQKVSLVGLPTSGAIEWGGQGPKVTVFSDFHCGYCRVLHQTLKAMGARVIERPISILGTRAISESVICAEDRSSAVEKAYSDSDVTKRACDTSGLDANEAFARAHGFTGTPVLVREDGAVLLGYRPREFLEVWLKGGA